MSKITSLKSPSQQVFYGYPEKVDWREGCFCV